MSLKQASSLKQPLFGMLPKGAWSDAPSEALVIPIAQSGKAQLAGLLVVGISPRREFDDDYQNFFDLIARNVATAIALMPDMDGYMLMRQIRTRPIQQGGRIPAIALTAYAGEVDQKQALAAGFQQHIAKPVEPDELVTAIARLVQHPRLT